MSCEVETFGCEGAFLNQSSEVERQEGNDQEVHLYLVLTNRMYTRNL